jgi:hypothetical protein
MIRLERIITKRAGGFLMSDPARIATPGVFVWRVASMLAPLFALLSLVTPIAAVLAAGLVALTLSLGFSTWKSMLQQGDSRRITLAWLGLSATSILALLAEWMLLTVPVPRYGDYFPREPVSPLWQAILDNASTLYWGASWIAVFTTIAGALVLGRVFQRAYRTGQLH